MPHAVSRAASCADEYPPQFFFPELADAVSMHPEVRVHSIRSECAREVKPEVRKR
jgi:hypothetical protein